jgi:hypothetical protein
MEHTTPRMLKQGITEDLQWFTIWIHYNVSL